MGRDGGGRVISSSKSKKKANGCMAAFYHLFDFHHFYFPSHHHHHHHHLTIDSPSRSKDLKLVDDSPPSTTCKDKQSLDIPVSMRVRTETGTTRTRLRALTNDTCTLSSEINSPGRNTPSLVARLMGLDLLPHTTDLPNLHTVTHYHLTSPRLSIKGTRLGTKSLPASPRISSARKSDFDIRRLSLQLSKENGCSRLKEMKQDQEENPSPTRRFVGMDITNSVKKRDAGPSQNTNELRRDSIVSCSPRTRFSNKENKPSTIQQTNYSSSFRPQRITQKPKPTTSIPKASGEKPNLNPKRVKQRQLRPINQCKKAESEKRFSPPPIKQRQREAFLSETRDFKANPLHKNKLKKIAKSNDVDNISATGPPQKEIHETQGLISSQDASICSSLMHKIEESGPQVSEKDCITRIMNLAGINTDSPVSSATILDPSVFCKLLNLGENPSGSLALRGNRRLLFDLVNEILIDTMELHAKRRPRYHRSELIGDICSAVASSVSKDVDHLLETKKLEEEGEGVVAEIERDIIDAIVRETASELGLNAKRIQTPSAGETASSRNLLYGP